MVVMSASHLHVCASLYATGSYLFSPTSKSHRLHPIRRDKDIHGMLHMTVTLRKRAQKSCEMRSRIISTRARIGILWKFDEE